MTQFSCPVCGSPQKPVAPSTEPRQARCSECDATWEQRGSQARRVKAGNLRGARPPGRKRLGVFSIRD